MIHDFIGNVLLVTLCQKVKCKQTNKYTNEENIATNRKKIFQHDYR